MLLRTLAIGVAVFLFWFGISRLIEPIPTPSEAANALLIWAKSTSDDVYAQAREREISQSVERVKRIADKHAREANRTERLPIGKAGKLRLGALVDSALQNEMRMLSDMPPVGGDVIHIVVVGVDSRLGDRGARADAIHLLTINPDSAVIDIASIPRGTYCDLGFPDSLRQNKITYARMRGRKAFQRHLERITGKRPIYYYIEAGFSQVMGILELLGYSDPVATLQFLRTRKAFYLGDIQRSYNQGMFVRKSILEQFPLLLGATGDVLLSAGLQFVQTNMDKQLCEGIIYALHRQGFPHHRKDAVRLRLFSDAHYDIRSILPDSNSVGIIQQWATKYHEDDVDHEQYVIARLRNIKRLAIRDSVYPTATVRRLNRLCEQHGWIQIRNRSIRTALRDSLTMLLERAYIRMEKHDEAERVARLREGEELIWKMRESGLLSKTRED
ncbi:MAG: hypothetical protein CL946_10790 [Ectothiorhodospiraceae bacterium]|nr:hypothetical protein [Ectothiorhodospiraceae bacterium]